MLAKYVFARKHLVGGKHMLFDLFDGLCAQRKVMHLKCDSSGQMNLFNDPRTSPELYQKDMASENEVVPLRRRLGWIIFTRIRRIP